MTLTQCTIEIQSVQECDTTDGDSSNQLST
jgi:hypothetical protein